MPLALRVRHLVLSAPLLVFASAAFAAAPLPSDWIDAKTRHRVIRLSPDTGGTSLYFHQRAYTPEGDKLVIRTRAGLVAVDLTTLGKTPPRSELVLADASPIATAWRTREAYFFARAEHTLKAVHLDTKVVRTVVQLPPHARGAQFALNCDETLLVAIGPDPDGKVVPRTPRPTAWAARSKPNGLPAPPR